MRDLICDDINFNTLITDNIPVFLKLKFDEKNLALWTIS